MRIDNSGTSVEQASWLQYSDALDSTQIYACRQY